MTSLFIFMRILLALSVSEIASGHITLVPINILNYYCSSLYITPLDTVSSLHETIAAKCPGKHSPNDISIVFKDKIILNPKDGRRSVRDIGITQQSNTIQIIQKPVFVTLLEMVADAGNKEKIPWFNRATRCLWNFAANQCQNISRFGGGLDINVDANLIEIDLSHLKLTGTIHLESLPQSVRSLDLSYNDLDRLNLIGLRGKSLRKLNVEHNSRLQVDNDDSIFHLKHIRGHNHISRTLQISSNQILSSVLDLRAKHFRIESWLYRQQIFDALIVNGKTIHRRSVAPFYIAMLNVVDEITNKHLIPWYNAFNEEESIAPGDLKNYSILHSTGYRRARSSRSRFTFDLNGLGLEGHIDLGCLPRNVMRMDLSNNNLSSISFVGGNEHYLRELNLQNNSRLQIDLAKCTGTSTLLWRLKRLLISSNQLVLTRKSASLRPEIAVRQWIRNTHLNEVILDDVVIAKRMVHRSDFEALFEMMSDIGNMQNIPWYQDALNCISSHFKEECLTARSEGLSFDGNGSLCAVDVSHLNLTGSLNLMALPKTVRALDLSFNDLDILHFDRLKGKFLLNLNVEHNDRYRVNTDLFETEFGRSLTIKQLQISSNQIFQIVPVPDTGSRHKFYHFLRIKKWLDHQKTLKYLIVDNVSISRCDPIPFYYGMLNVVNGIKNKHRIPWYHYFANGMSIPSQKQQRVGIGFNCAISMHNFKKCRSLCCFNLSGLGLEWHIDLGYLPKYVLKLDLSNNNLSTISFVGEAQYNLKELNLQNNDNLRVDLKDIDQSSIFCCLCHLNRLFISSNQLVISEESMDMNDMKKCDVVRAWMKSARVMELFIDSLRFQ